MKKGKKRRSAGDTRKRKKLKAPKPPRRDRRTVEQSEEVPHDLRGRLEEERLNSLILFRTLDRLGLGSDELERGPLRELMELDADCAEALWALDQPLGKIVPSLMVRDTLASLHVLTDRRIEYFAGLPKQLAGMIDEALAIVARTIDPNEAYNGVPGRDPTA